MDGCNRWCICRVHCQHSGIRVDGLVLKAIGGKNRAELCHNRRRAWCSSNVRIELFELNERRRRLSELLIDTRRSLATYIHVCTHMQQYVRPSRRCRVTTWYGSVGERSRMRPRASRPLRARLLPWPGIPTLAGRVRPAGAHAQRADQRSAPSSCRRMWSLHRRLLGMRTTGRPAQSPSWLAASPPHCAAQARLVVRGCRTQGGRRSPQRDHRATACWTPESLRVMIVAAAHGAPHML